MTDIDKAVEQAARAADAAPEQYRQTAFTEVLKYLLAVARPKRQTAERAPESAASRADSGDEVMRAQWEQKVIEGLPEAHVVEKGSREQQTMWAVITLWSRGESATTEPIRNCIRTEIGITPQNSPNTARTLSNLHPGYLERERIGQGRYAYTPLARALQVFDGLVGE